MAYRIISVSYGHGTKNSEGNYTPSGKLYDYATDKEYRTGDTVVVPVEHPISHKLYNTLAVVRLTHKFDTPAGQRVAEHLTDPNNDIKPKEVGFRLAVAKMQGLNVKTDRDVNITTLPGYNTRGTDRKWSEEPPTMNNSSRFISRGE